MEYYLMYHLDQGGLDGIVLKNDNDLESIDNFIINNFKTRSDLLKFYMEDISEFCLDRKEKIINENIRNNHNRLGSISLFCKYENSSGVNIIKIPIIYGNDKKLLANDICIKIIKEKLDDINVLKKILITKEYLLSHNERDILKNYLRLRNNSDKNKFIDYFVNRIKKMNNVKKYFFFRNLMNLCKLNTLELKTLSGNIKLSKEVPLNTRLEKDHELKKFKLESYLDDDYFTSLIENGDYDSLNKYYDIETIEKGSNIRSKK